MIALRGLGRRITGTLGALVAWGFGRQSIGAAATAGRVTLAEQLRNRAALVDAARGSAALGDASAHTLTLATAARNALAAADRAGAALTLTDALVA